MSEDGLAVHRLAAQECVRLRELRLRALDDAPEAFSATFEETAARSLEEWRVQLGRIPTFVAVRGDADIGILRIVPNHDGTGAGLLISMWVAPEARRRGVGTALIEASLDWARAQGIDRLMLDVGDSNETAIAFYERLGFRVWGSAPGAGEHRRMRPV